ncbi:sensor histidine kinase [Streptomyces sp. NPDC091272]|uniref:sensor histidine kinase n=1 Tax=Streptomyces sp. NPDC091272 TaxID=3365981 RepID=UPI00381CD057
MKTDLAPRLAGRQQAWRLAAAVAAGVPVWLTAGVLVHHGQVAGPHLWFRVGDPLVALCCLTALWWRRRFPLAVVLTVTLVSAVSALATGAALLGMVSLSARRRPLEIGAAVLVHVGAFQFALAPYAALGLPTVWWAQLLFPVLTGGIAVAVGVAVGARRAEVRSLQEQARSAEREQSARTAQARATERNRIAREMHDVLAHRISLVAMQAAVLDHRPDLTPEDSGTLIRGIAQSSHQALEELRDVLGVLRTTADPPETSQPSVENIPDLLDDARSAGLDVTLTDSVTGTPPRSVGRTCYRTVQEGLTNAAKHAPGSRVHVVLEGKPGHALAVTVHNSPAAAAPSGAPASGFGLLGLAERVSLVGGELIHHPTADDGYLLAAQLPWPGSRQEESA